MRMQRNLALSFWSLELRRRSWLEGLELWLTFLALSPNKERAAKIGDLHGWFSTTLSPVSDYGQKFTQDLMITTQVLSEIAVQSLAENSKKVALESPRLVSEETGRGLMAEREGIGQDMAPLSSLVEGILSFHQLLILTLNEKVPGIDSGSDALRAFVFGGATEIGMTSALVKRIPLAVVGPMANAGVTFKNSFVLDSNGKLAISQHLIDILAKHQERAGKSVRPRRVCPMSLLFQGRTLSPTSQLNLRSIKPGCKTWLKFIGRSTKRFRSCGQVIRNPSRLRSSLQIACKAATASLTRSNQVYFFGDLIIKSSLVFCL